MGRDWCARLSVLRRALGKENQMTLWPYHSEDEISAVADVLRSGKTNYWSGPNGQAFESEFAAYTGAKHALAVTNGTSAFTVNWRQPSGNS